MADLLDLEQLNLIGVLRELYTAQQCSFFAENAMQKIMEQYCLSKEQAIELAKLLIKEELISTKGFLTAMFLCPQHIQNFPLILNTKAIKLLIEYSRDKR